MNFKTFKSLMLLMAAAGALSACYTRPPTIAHVHIGHAVTAVHVTPEHKGYLAVAEQRAGQALVAANNAATDTSLARLKSDVAAAVDATSAQDTFGVKESLIMAANHISFAATSPDASANVVRTAPIFAQDITASVGRCDYIVLLGRDVTGATSLKEGKLLAGEIQKLAQANLNGEDSNGDGVVGSAPTEYGLIQLRAEVQAMIDRENPRYRTVDEWYLFNLVRLPNGKWVYDKLSRGGNIDGYK